MENASNQTHTKLDVDVYVRQMWEKMEERLRQVGEAVNAAPDEAWINDSEWEVRDIFADLRQEAYEKALQMRMDAAQAAFSPGGPRDRPAAGEQGV